LLKNFYNLFKENKTMEISEDLWKRVDDLRGKMSIRELAEKSGLGEGTLQTTRVMKSVPKTSTLFPIAKALNTSMDYLYSGQEAPDNFDAPIFRKLSSSQDLIDICTALITAEPAEIEIIKRILRIDKPKQEPQQELF
jgi:transcriptional regulator with XRE-family HTH domain